MRLPLYGSRVSTPLEGVIAIGAILLSTVAVASPARAAEAPRWQIVSMTNPTTIVPGHAPEPQLVIVATNVGGAATDGSTVTIQDSLPAQYTATAVTGYSAYQSGSGFNGEGFGESPMTCAALPSLECTYGKPVDPGDALIMTVRMSAVTAAIAGAENVASVAGGGAASSSTTLSMATSDSPAAFGPVPNSVFAATSTNQAGAHPDVTAGFAIATKETNEASGYPKDIRFDLPPGLVGSTVGFPRCPTSHVIEQLRNPNGCPADSMVGIATATLSEGAAREFNQTVVAPIYNIAPNPGEPAAFAFNAFFFPVRLDTSVLSGDRYSVRISAAGLPESAETLSVQTTFWGVPADHSGPGADISLYNLLGGGSFGGPDLSQTREPLLTNPQQCAEPVAATVSLDSWSNPGDFVASEPSSLGGFVGCERLSFEPLYTLRPDDLRAGVPAGYAFALTVPAHSEPDALATPNLKDVALTLPNGVVVNPSVAGGLQACSDAQFGLASESSAACPSGSRIGGAEVLTPSFPLPLHGDLYIGEPQCDPCAPQDAEGGRLIRLFLQVQSEGESGIVVKLQGTGRISPTGQITASFENDPQLPFTELKVSLNGGARAPLTNPRSCGAFQSSLDATPWSAPATPGAHESDAFDIGQGCFGAQFAPAFAAGTGNVQAGAFTPFTVAFGRGDQDQFISGLEVQMPPGLLGKLSSVALCREPQAAAGSCGPESLIGHVRVLLGAGPTPYSVEGGQAFLTGGYKGAPFGLSVVIPAVAGPYTLAGTTGHGTVVVRASIAVDPRTAALTVKSDPLPTALDGIPLQVKAVRVEIDRSGFVLNPTNCNGLVLSGRIASEQGSVASVSTPLGVTNCATLPFKPGFAVSTQAKTSKANGASLHVKVTSSAGQANIAKVKVDLPRQLPSRLTTLQKACVASVFEANPASCPAASNVGSATAVTPILKSILAGPAYLVSHGGAAFPDLEIVLQGEGITLVLDGRTNIKKGVTISYFETVPDAPIASFDLVLPTGPHSALTANLPTRAKRSMCRQRLSMPTQITGQNGAVVRRTTKISVAGCPKHKKPHRKARRSEHERRSHAKR